MNIRTIIRIIAKPIFHWWYISKIWLVYSYSSLSGNKLEVYLLIIFEYIILVMVLLSIRNGYK
jgi:hypothetical protein